jgi:hypothetical protein
VENLEAFHSVRFSYKNCTFNIQTSVDNNECILLNSLAPVTTDLLVVSAVYPDPKKKKEN